MDSQEGVAGVATAHSPVPNFDAVFHAHYASVTRAVERVIGDHARAEDIAIEAFCKLWRQPTALGDGSGGWLRKTAIRLALDELRRTRPTRVDSGLCFFWNDDNRIFIVSAGQLNYERAIEFAAATR